MTKAAKALESQLLSLSEKDRRELAGILYNSLENGEFEVEYDEEWEAELDRRMAEYDRDPSYGEPGDKVLSEIREKYSRKKRK